MSKIVGLFLKIVVLGVLAKSLEKTEKGVCFFSKARSCRPYSLFKNGFLQMYVLRILLKFLVTLSNAGKTPILQNSS